MGSKISKAVRRRRYVEPLSLVASPPVPACHDNSRTEPCQDQDLPVVSCRGPPAALDVSTDALTSSPEHDNQRIATLDITTPETEIMEALPLPSPGYVDDNVFLSELPDPDILQHPSPRTTYRPPPPPPLPPPPPAVPETVYECIICCTPFAKGTEHTVVRPCRCQGVYCASCIRNMFISACKDISRMPPRCCTQIPLHHARPHLTEEEADLFRAKYEEWSTPKPLYCPAPTCSAFIPSRLLPHPKANTKGKQRVDSGIATPTPLTITCPRCETAICTHCRDFAHLEATCSPLDFGIDAQTAELLKSWGYKRCPKCANGVRRMYGCNHMECRCGAHFCWVCLKSREDCDGQCYDENDYDDDDADEEEDEEATAAESNENNDSRPPTDVPTESMPEAHNSAGLAPSQEAPPPPTTTTTEPPVSPPPRPLSRPRNLDAGSGSYWEAQDMDFGHEPTDDVADRAWDCLHDFDTAKVSLPDSLRGATAATGMECMKCWHAIHPEIKIPHGAKPAGMRMVSGSAVAGRGLRGDRRVSGNRFARRARGLGVRFGAAARGSAVELGFPAPFDWPRQPIEGAELRDSASVDVPMHDPAVDAETVFDTYGRPVFTTAETASEDTRRASIDVIPSSAYDFLNLNHESLKTLRAPCLFANPHPGPPVQPQAAAQAVTHTPTTKLFAGLNADGSAPFSFAYECAGCGLLVCSVCKEGLLAPVAG